MKKVSELEKFIGLYGFNTGDVKWVPIGGSLLEYIGQTVVFVHYERSEGGGYSSSFKMARIHDIYGYDPITMTWSIDYELEEEMGTIKTEKIIPEGFSLDFVGGGIQQSMNRFLPYSVHVKLVEMEYHYNRLTELFKDRPTMTLEHLQNLSQSKDQSKTLKYAMNIQAVVKLADERICYFRIGSIKVRRGEWKDSWRIVVTDMDGSNSYSVLAEKDDESYELISLGETIGEMKILDISGLEKAIIPDTVTNPSLEEPTKMMTPKEVVEEIKDGVEEHLEFNPATGKFEETTNDR